MWCLIYAKHKLTLEQSKSLKHVLSGMAFSCGAPLEEMDLPKSLEGEAFVRELNFHDSIEILYYTAKYEPICIYCGQPQPFSSESAYPHVQCDDCKEKAYY